MILHILYKIPYKRGLAEGRNRLSCISLSTHSRSALTVPLWVRWEHLQRDDSVYNRMDGGIDMQKDLGSIRFGSPFSSKRVVYGHCLVTLPTQLMKY